MYLHGTNPRYVRVDTGVDVAWSGDAGHVGNHEHLWRYWLVRLLSKPCHSYVCPEANTDDNHQMVTEDICEGVTEALPVPDQKYWTLGRDSSCVPYMRGNEHCRKIMAATRFYFLSWRGNTYAPLIQHSQPTDWSHWPLIMVENIPRWYPSSGHMRSWVFLFCVQKAAG